jgi:hypothetical protein
MTTDGYAEHIVKTKTPTGIIAILVLGIAMAAAGVCILLFISPPFGLLLVVAGVLIFAAAWKRRECEFEYLMVNDDVEVARILAKSSRKQVYQFENAEVKLITKLDSILLDNEHQANPGIRCLDFTSKQKENRNDMYAFVLNKKNRTEEVRLELSDKALEHVKVFFKGKYRE